MSLKKIYLELTNKCNLNCTICYRRSWSETPQDMSEELFRKIKKELNEIKSVEQVVLGGIGEPTYAPLIGEALKELGEYKLTLTTNGVYLNNAILDSIVKYVDLVMISIDGLHENYSSIRGTELAYVLENIKQINKLKERTKKPTPVIGIQFVLSDDNAGDVFSLIDLANDSKVEIVAFSNLLPQTEENARKILYKRYANLEVKQMFHKVVSYAFRKGIKLILPHWELKTECGFIEDNTTFVCASGEVVPCYRLSHTYKEFVFGREKTVIRHSFGNLQKKSLKEIWENKEYKNFRESVANNKYPSCIDCDLADSCDLVKDTISDCYAGTPSCADCLWSRKFVICP